ncbi:MAG: CDGSH iron-sulfur domain-containing protein [Mitsuaria chitosanitabida]|uniref:CDGSH iron-sulfur domain-containing protein n=1 Tax=Roseateles chitosanitabidus TaxID=65048 RepID=UPI001B13EC44|nr:CDGSH iron-sulfur domain-containing protein [Roseateles chitosanitabidus]MBO9687055.1 CDGSH iron-sulfur domain-containing protein [Roseateles chitosanitabidus]
MDSPRATPPTAPEVHPVERACSAWLEVRFDGNRCIHARQCVTGAPATFLADVEGPWIRPAMTPLQDLMAVIRNCPSGALSYRRLDGGPPEHAPPVNLLTLRENGPYAVRARLAIEGADAAPIATDVGYRATLCRCGGSRRKPFCDNSHRRNGFEATGEPPSGRTAALAVRDGPLAIAPQVDGPLEVRGQLEIVSGTGRIVERTSAVTLCRCGASRNKPFCDDSHLRIGFRTQESSS